jgi:RNA polymerase sigma-70 factor, ECF subfamily
MRWPWQDDERRRLGRARRGDEQALARLYEDHVDALYAFVFYRVGRDVALAEDVVQQTFLEALSAVEEYDPARGSVGAWLCSRSRNVIRKHLRERPRGAELDAVWERVDRALADVLSALDREPLGEEVIAREETRDLVNMAVANLPERYRDVLARKYIQGEALTTIAGALSLSEDGVKSLLARARHAFKDTFLALTRELAEERR